jgi:protein-arginine kinase
MVLLVALPLKANEYTPPTRANIQKYIESLSMEQLIDEILRLDLLENSLLDFEFPEYSAVLTKDNTLFITPLSEKVLISLEYLKYSAKLPQLIFENFQKEEVDYVQNYVLSAVSGFVAGVIFMVILPKGD